MCIDQTLSAPVGCKCMNLNDEALAHDLLCVVQEGRNMNFATENVTTMELGVSVIRCRTVLLVDDSKCIVTVLERILKAEAFTVITAHDGCQAVATFLKSAVGLILMDMEMPVMNGRTATQAIRQLASGSTVPIIAITGHDDPEETKRCLDAGCTAVLKKPVKKEELLQIIRGFQTEVMLPRVC